MTNQNITVGIKILSENATVPEYAKPGDAGFDLAATETMIFDPHETQLVPTGLAFEVPPGYEIQIRPRSGMSARTGLRVANAPGTIDAGYRGEVFIILTNQSDEPEKIERGQRIAQGVLAKVPQAEFVVTDELSQTERGTGGIGSTGK